MFHEGLLRDTAREPLERLATSTDFQSPPRIWNMEILVNGCYDLSGFMTSKTHVAT
jgi:hypothetical protein